MGACCPCPEIPIHVVQQGIVFLFALFFACQFALGLETFKAFVLLRHLNKRDGGVSCYYCFLLNYTIITCFSILA